MVILAVLIANITLEGGDQGENDKNSKSMSFFLSTVKHSRDLRAHKINIITAVKRAMTRGSSGIKGHLARFLNPSPKKTEKVIPKKNSCISGNGTF